ncbi:MAG: N-6 DNA methylase [Anaerolineales bacterium]|nr:N-6 DNA methylase [Anaerolineales bacterium]
MTTSNHPTPQKIIDLVDHFSTQLDDYKAGKYNETQLRRDFLDPFFAELGWDMNNEEQFSERYREVIHEMSVEVEGKAKAADYAFRLGGSTIFFLEAKKPYVNVGTSQDAAFQIRRYAWSAKVPVSIVSDFEQLAVYDCRSKPTHSDAVHIGRVELYHYTEFIEKWNEIYNIFSKEAVLKGSFDRYAEGLKGKRGTADVDDAFLVEMERWREELARNIALRNPDLSTRQINESVQLTIDRIIFLRICEERGIEAEDALRNATDGKEIYKDLMELFQLADRKYNSGLFHFSQEKNQSSYPDTLTPRIIIDDKVLKDILANLYYPKSPYAFKYISADILGQVYERFLGKVIRLTAGHQAKVEEKPEVRKAGGVYYTPTYIVNYIVKNTIGELLKDKTPADMEKAPLRVLDPACGSGSFLLGAYQYMLDWYQDWYEQHDPHKWNKGKNPPIMETRDGWQLTMDKKKDILTSHIFGVDIDAQAVEVTKLSLLLKVVENPGQLSLLAERILPDLSKNIQCGNSLIGPDFYKDKQIGFLDEEEQYRVNAFDWQQAFPQVFREGGFGVVIGNPPYGADFNKEEKNYIRSNYASYMYKYDSYIYFIEKGISLLKPCGFICFITPEVWTKLESSTKLREYILTNAGLDLLLICGENVFSQAIVNTIVFRAHKNSLHKNLQIEQTGKENIIVGFDHWENSDNFVIDYRIHPRIQKIIKKLQNQDALSQFGEVIQGITAYDKYRGQSKETIKSRAYHFDHKHDDTCGKWLAGKDVNRYRLGWSKEWLSYGLWLAAPRDEKFFIGERLLFREVPGIGKRIQAMIVYDTYYYGHSITPFKKSIENKHNSKYLLGIVNSWLISWYGGFILPNFGKEIFPKLNPKDISLIPIRTIDFDNPVDLALHNRMVNLVESMLEMHKQLQAPLLSQEKEHLERQITYTDQQIDKLVYELYGLTDEEIKIVEENGRGGS